MKCEDPWCDLCELYGEKATTKSCSKIKKRMFRRLKSKRRRQKDKKEVLIETR